MAAHSLPEQAQREVAQAAPAVPAPRQEFGAGARATVPLVLGAIPFGIIFGAVAVNGGLSGAAAAGMSALVYAGSSQFVAAQLVSGGAGLAVIVLTTFVVNLRHALYAVSLAPHMKHLPARWQAPLAFWLTDETFLVVIDHYNRPGGGPNKHWYYLGSALLMYTNWQLSTMLGVLAGQAIPNPQSWGLDFALPLTFIGMLVPRMIGIPMIACVAAAGVSAVLFHGLEHQLWLIVATLAGVAAGVAAQAAQAARRARQSRRGT